MIEWIRRRFWKVYFKYYDWRYGTVDDEGLLYDEGVARYNDFRELLERDTEASNYDGLGDSHRGVGRF